MINTEIDFPSDMDAGAKADLVAREQATSLGYQRDGKVKGIWRVVGRYANFTLYDCESNDELHRLLSGLPLFPYMDIQVVPLALHPSSLEANPDS
ncbi:MAG: muconolactone Delta-isomerase family protein [Acidimicrobiia bacterium]